MDADLDPTKEKLGWLKGMAYGVRPNEAVRPLFLMEGFSYVRTKRLQDGSWRRTLREIVFYRDIDSGKILDTWHNPYSNEQVRVVHVANDPFNYTIKRADAENPKLTNLPTPAPVPAGWTPPQPPPPMALPSKAS